LAREQLRRIIEIQLGYLSERLAQRDLKLEVSTAAQDFLTEVGWDPQFGARPLKRAIQRHVEDALARRVLAGEFMPGDTIVADRAPGGELTFTRRPAQDSTAPAGSGTRPAAAHA
jgi:ATP-dependent Clp protease ATP-binding subunit ClpB